MARMPRLCPADFPLHIMGRGINGQPIFHTQEDRHYFIELICNHLQRFVLACHGFVLMDNHYHLLLTPSRNDSTAMFMRHLQKNYTDHYNHTYKRTGPLWQGRYKSALIDSEAYLLSCMAYIDLNPVRAGLVQSAPDYAWSSARHHLGLESLHWMSHPAIYWQLGNTPFAREAAYADFIATRLHPSHTQQITHSIQRNLTLGSPAFLSHIQNLTPKRITPGKAGRPFKLSSST